MFPDNKYLAVSTIGFNQKTKDAEISELIYFALSNMGVFASCGIFSKISIYKKLNNDILISF